MENITVQSLSKGVRMSPRKVALVAGLVRGRSVADALVILQHTPKRAAIPMTKAITSAKANALNNHQANEADLVIEHLTVTAGTRLKRFRPAAMGRALPFQKKTSHIKVVLSASKKQRKAPAKTEAAAVAAEPNTEGKKG